MTLPENAIIVHSDVDGVITYSIVKKNGITVEQWKDDSGYGFATSGGGCGSGGISMKNNDDNNPLYASDNPIDKSEWLDAEEADLREAVREMNQVCDLIKKLLEKMRGGI